MSKQTIKDEINLKIRTNGEGLITGQMMNDVLNHIVDDYGEQEKLSELDQRVNELKYMERDAIYTECHWVSGGKFVNWAGYKGIYVSVGGLEKISIDLTQVRAYTFTTTNKDIVNQSPDYASGYTAMVLMTSTSQVLDIPADANYLLINISANEGDVPPLINSLVTLEKRLDDIFYPNTFSNEKKIIARTNIGAVGEHPFADAFYKPCHWVSGGKFVNWANYQGMMIYVDGSSIIDVDLTQARAYAFLRDDYDEINQPPHYASDYTAMVLMTSAKQTLSVPADAKYLLVNISNDGSGITPNVNSLKVDASFVLAVKQLLSEGQKSAIRDNIDVYDKAYIDSRIGTYASQYVGEPISLATRGFNIETFKVFAHNNLAQSCVIYGDYILLFFGNLRGSIFRISTSTKVTDFVINSGGKTSHANAVCIGNEFASGNSDFPLVYLSQWDAEGGVLVLDIRLDGTCNMVQYISTANMDVNVFGGYLGDWVVDTDRHKIYSIKYLSNTGDPEVDAVVANGNATCVCEFELPQLSDGNVITYTPADINANFILPVIRINQDKTYHNGKVYIAAGSSHIGEPQTLKLVVVDVIRRCIVSVADMSFTNNEMECLSVYNDRLIYNGYNNNTQFNAMVF